MDKYAFEFVNMTYIPIAYTIEVWVIYQEVVAFKMDLRHRSSIHLGPYTFAVGLNSGPIDKESTTTFDEDSDMIKATKP